MPFAMICDSVALSYPMYSYIPGKLKRFYAFGGLWNKNYEADIQNKNINLSVKV